MKRTNLPFPQQIEMLAIEAFKSSGFLIVNKTLIKQFGLITAVVLSNYIDKHVYFRKEFSDNDGWFYLTHKQQMEQLGIKENSLRKCKKELVEADLLEIKRKGIPSREWYKINFIKLANVTGVHLMKTEGVQLMNSIGHIKENKKDKEKYSSSDSSKNGQITPSQFEKFWNLYPKKAGRGAALTRWNTICSKEPKQRPTWIEIKKAVFNQKKSQQWQNATFIPHATTWLNQSRWLDDPAEMKSYDRENDKPNSFIEYGDKWTKDKNGTYRNSKGVIFSE